MSDSQQPLDPNIRRKRLDDLFADEPYLSPTMKARSLHQKLEQNNGAVGVHANRSVMPDIPPPPEPRLSRTAAAPSLTIETTPPQTIAPPEPPVVHRVLGFFEAAAHLRQAATGQGKTESPEGERLQRFRENVLLKWLPAAPKREKKG